MAELYKCEFCNGSGTIDVQIPVENVICGEDYLHQALGPITVNYIETRVCPQCEGRRYLNIIEYMQVGKDNGEV